MASKTLPWLEFAGVVKYEKCGCKFVWCCRVECDTCERHYEVQTCRWARVSHWKKQAVSPAECTASSHHAAGPDRTPSNGRAPFSSSRTQRNLTPEPSLVLSSWFYRLGKKVPLSWELPASNECKPHAFLPTPAMSGPFFVWLRKIMLLEVVVCFFTAGLDRILGFHDTFLTFFSSRIEFTTALCLGN